MVKTKTKTVHHNTVKKAINDIRCVNRAHNTHINALKRVGKKDLPNKWHQMDGLLNMRGKGTKTEYLVQWAGRQENGEPWPPTWEPQKQIARAHERQFNLRFAVLKAIGLDPMVCLRATHEAKKKKDACLLLHLRE